jgi:Tol biopolymer transport system component
MTMRISLFAVAACWLLVACTGDPSKPAVPKVLATLSGTAERGQVVSVSVTRDGTPVDTTAFTLSVIPQSAVQQVSRSQLQLLQTGSVRIIATASNVSDTIEVVVAAPPSILFELVTNGNRDIWRVALDGGDLRRVTSNLAEELWPSAAKGYVYYLSYRASPAAVFRVHADSAQESAVTTSGTYDEISVSPDATQLLFTRGDGGVAKVWVSAIDGSGARRLTAAGSGVIEASPAWSADGKNVVFVTTLNGNADIYTVSAAGGTAQPLVVSPQPDLDPAWNPAGTEVVFTRGNGGELDLQRVPAAGGTITRLTTAAGVESRPIWLHDGRIVLEHDIGAAKQLFWIDPAAPTVLHAIPQTIGLTGRPAELR